MNNVNTKLKVAFLKQGVNPEGLQQLGNEIIEPIFYIARFREDYSNVFRILVSRMLSMNPMPPLEDRIEAITLMTEAYINQTEEAPDGTQLNLLANWLLVEVLQDSHPDKVTRTEFPIMNKGQLRTRHHRERADEFIEGKTLKGLTPTKKKNTTEFDSY